MYTLVFRLASMAVAAALGILTARVLGSHGRGLYATPMVDAGIVTAAFTGLSSATSYFLLRRGAGRAIVRAALLSALAFLASGVCATVLLTLIGHALWAAPAAALSLTGPAIMMVVIGYATGTHRVRLTTSFGLENTGLTLLVMAATFAIGARNATGAIMAWLIATNLMGLCLLSWMVVDSRRLETGNASTREYMRYAARAGIVGLVTLLNYRADVYIVAVLGSPAMLGMYTLAVSAAEALLAATQVTAVVTAPHVGSLEEGAAAQLAARAVRHNVLVAGVCCGALALIAPFAVRLLYGASFVPVVPALRVLLVGVFALSLGSPMSTYFTIRLGRPEVPLVLASASALVCIVASLILVPRIGLVGAALASTVAYMGGQTAAIVWFGSASGISATTMLVPRRSDIATYVSLAASLLARKSAGDSRAAGL